MATKAKTDVKELSVEDKLKALYSLQLIVTEIDRIKTLRGELPLEVQDLEDEIAGMETRVEHYTNDIQEFNHQTAQKNIEMQNAKSMVEKYSTQQTNVRNNKEYDFLTKEIEFQSLEIELCSKRIAEYASGIEQKEKELKRINDYLTEKRIDLTTKKEELDDIIAETKSDEEKLRLKVKKVESNITPNLLAAFKRIRRSVRNGLAVVIIDRDACGGCFNKIPAQRQLDVKMQKKIIVCEYCGRFLIDNELASNN